MNLKDIENYFKDKLLEHGNSAEGMDWKNQETQYLRFERIAGLIDFGQNPSVLDVGSGTSEFFEFCRQRNLNCRYTGIDIVPEMVEIANQRFGKPVAKVGDLLTDPGTETYDYVIASGTFNAKLTADAAAWETFFYDNLAAMHKVCNKAIVFNTMTQFVDWEYDRLYYPNIERLSGFIVKNLGRRFKIDHAYNLYEMTVYVEKAE